MASMTFTIPDPQAPRVLDAFAVKFGWTAGLGVTKGEFARQQVMAFVKDVVIEVESTAAVNTARAALVADVNAIGIE